MEKSLSAVVGFNVFIVPILQTKQQHIVCSSTSLQNNIDCYYNKYGWQTKIEGQKAESDITNQKRELDLYFLGSSLLLCLQDSNMLSTMVFGFVLFVWVFFLKNFYTTRKQNKQNQTPNQAPNQTPKYGIVLRSIHFSVQDNNFSAIDTSFFQNLFGF